MKKLIPYDSTITGIKTALLSIGVAWGGIQIGSLYQTGRMYGPFASAAFGILIGGSIWMAWRYLRSKALWLPNARALGFQPVYSGHFPAIPFQVPFEAVNLLKRTTVAGEHYVGHWGAPDH